MQKVRTKFATASLWIISFLILGTSVAFAALTFSGTNISGDSGVVINSSTTISIGASGVTTTFPGNVVISGKTFLTPTSSLLYATSTGQVTGLSLGTNLSISGGTLNAAGGGSSTSTNQSLRVDPIGFDGGGVPLTGSDETCTYIPYAANLSALKIVSECAGGTDCTGSATVNVATESFTNYTSSGMGGATSIGTGTLSSAYAVTTSLNVNIASDTMMCFIGSNFTNSVRLNIYPIMTAN